MTTFFFTRLLATVPVVLGVVSIVSLLIHLIPGNPVDVILGPFATAEERRMLSQSLGLDLPLMVQFKNDLLRFLTGDLGNSLVLHRPVVELIGQRFPSTFQLACTALALAITISLPLGICSALRPKSWLDWGTMSFAILGVCIPGFWLGPILMMLFSLKLGWLPVSEKTDIFSFILPSITIALPLSAILSRMVRATMLETLSEDFIRTARAKGSPEWRVILVHGLRPASLPLITIVGLQFGALLTGAIITERIFDWPGVGSLMLEGIQNRDYPTVQGCVLVYSLVYIVVNLLVDLLVGIADPRIRLKNA